MEQLLHYVWKHKLFPIAELHTVDGRCVEVVDVGLHNVHAGPDFFNAKVRIGGTMWVGNVEIHDKASDWFQHGHDRDTRYDNVVLHIVGKADAQAVNSKGKAIDQLVLAVPDSLVQHYGELQRADRYPPCHQIVGELPKLMVHSWLAALQTERLEQKTATILQRLDRLRGSWEATYFATLARNFGFGVNGDAFEQWAEVLDLQAVGHHRNDLFQIEAIFFGQAGLLHPQSIPERYRAQAQADEYYQSLRSEYQYLRHKFSLAEMDYQLWRFLRLRPQNFPHMRISQLAQLYHRQQASLAHVLDCKEVNPLRRLLRTAVTPYWQDHYLFGAPSRHQYKQLTLKSVDLIVINTVVPVLFAYGRQQGREQLCDRAFHFLEQLRAEQNHIVRTWHDCGIDVRTAADSQALVQLNNAYCERKDCLRCRIGYEYLKRR